MKFTSDCRVPGKPEKLVYSPGKPAVGRDRLFDRSVCPRCISRDLHALGLACGVYETEFRIIASAAHEMRYISIPQDVVGRHGGHRRRVRAVSDSLGSRPNNN